MYGILYADGGIDMRTNDLGELKQDFLWSIQMSEAGDFDFDGATPVVQVGTNSRDLSWETFSDAYNEIPDAWFEWLSTP